MANGLLDDIGYFQLAKNASKYSNLPYKIGAVVAKAKPIGIGFNFRKSLYSTHAERKAVINSNGADLEGAEIWVYRETADGIPALAFPCIGCYDFLKSKGIYIIHYSLDKPPFYKTYIMENK